MEFDTYELEEDLLIADIVNDDYQDGIASIRYGYGPDSDEE